MDINKLKKEYEENLKWIDDYQKVVKNIKDLQMKIKHLEELKTEIVNNNTNEVVNSFGHYERLPYFYIDLMDYVKDFRPKIYLDSKHLFNLKSTYGYFKEKLEEYVGKKLTLIEVVTPIYTRRTIDRDGEEEIYTTVHHLLVTDERLNDLEKDLRYMSMNSYRDFLANDGVFVLKKTSIYSDYKSETPSYQKLNEMEQYYFFSLNDFRNREKNLIKEPIVTKYDKKLDDILLEVFDYSVKLEKLKVIAEDKETTEKRINEHEELKQKSEKLKKEIDGIMDLIK